MNNEQLAKHWKIIEVQLTQAAEFLNEPERFTIEQRELSQYRNEVCNKKFELKMDKLAELAIEFGCQSGFWRRLKKPAIQMGLRGKAEQYEALFQQALEQTK